MTRAPTMRALLLWIGEDEDVAPLHKKVFETRAYGPITRTSVNWGDSIPTWLHVAQRFRELIAAKAKGPKRVASDILDATADVECSILSSRR